MKRGEIWWVGMPLPAGKRPVVLASRDSSYACIYAAMQQNSDLIFCLREATLQKPHS